MTTYEGICRYCGSIEAVMAESQEEADVLVTKKCTCEAGELEQKRQRLMENIREVCTDSIVMRKMDTREVQAVQAIATWVLEQDIEDIKIGFAHSSIRIWKSADKIKVKRTAKVEEARDA